MELYSRYRCSTNYICLATKIWEKIKKDLSFPNQVTKLTIMWKRFLFEILQKPKLSHKVQLPFKYQVRQNFKETFHMVNIELLNNGGNTPN